jgi:zinc transport system substrate-binding protein
MRIVSKQYLPLLALFAALSCASEGDPSQRVGNRVFVSIVPLEFFAERIGGSRVTVRALVGPGQSPATYEPTAKQMTELAESDVLFTVGVPMEERLVPRVRSGFPTVAVVDVREGMPLREADYERLIDEPVSGAEHVHETDPHVWLSPRLSMTIAKNMAETLSRLDPQHAAEYRRNYRLLVEELERLDADLTQLFAPHRGKELVVYHPAYGYFANEYGLEQVAVEAGGVAPGSRRLAQLIAQARARGVKTIFVQPQISPTAARTIAEVIGAEVIQLDPLARDYIENLWDMAIKIQSAYANG